MENRKQDNDSFASLTGGLRNNWIFVMAIFAVGFWIVTNVNDSKNINMIQDGDIKESRENIEILRSSVSDLTTEMRANVRANDSNNAEILRRLDLVQKDIDFIKQK